MCTATWLMRPDGYELFFNRDEQRTRPTARPPTLRTAQGVRFLAPTDPAGGGTWLAVNERGVTLALLNYYSPHPDPPPRRTSAGQPPLASPLSGRRGESQDAGFRSRGQLILELITQPAITFPSLTAYRPFLLLALPAPRLWRWDGITLAEIPATPPVTTSSFDTANVLRARHAAYDALECHDKTTLTRYHLTGFDAYSVCLNRPDARTVSFSRIAVGQERIEFEYRGFDDPPLVTRRTIERERR